MKKSFLGLAALCSTAFFYAQTHQVKVYYNDGKVVNIGSSKTVNSIHTAYDSKMNQYVRMNIKENTGGREATGYIGLGFPHEIDSISFVPEGEARTIYQYIKDKGTYSYTLRLVDELGYTSVLDGVKSNYTLFAAEDAVWRLFLASPDCPVKNYESLNVTQKRKLLERMLLRNSQPKARLGSLGSVHRFADSNESSVAYLYEVSGSALKKARLRQENIASPDTLYVPASKLPSGKYWEAFRQSGGVRLLPAYGDLPPATVFTKTACGILGITEQDLEILTRTSSVAETGMYFYDIPVEGEIHCLNGYIYQLGRLAFPPGTIDQELQEIPECALFASFLDRFSMPVALPHYTDTQRPGVRKSYFAQKGTYALIKDSAGVYQDRLLFDPSWIRSHYQSGEEFEQNMSVLFAPTDQALSEWWDSSMGNLMMGRYSSWEEVPNELLAQLINNHMKVSFNEAVPSKFGELQSEGGRVQGIKKEDVVKVVQANNGVIYVVNKVYTPDRYLSVMAPALYLKGYEVMGWSIMHLDRHTYNPDGYGTYLVSMDNTLALILPPNEAFQNCIDPFYVSQDGGYRKVSLSYTNTNRLRAVWTPVSKEGIEGVSQTTESYLSGSTLSGDVKIQSLLKEILNNCIVPLNRENWQKGGYFQTKGGTHLNISAFNQGATVRSGGNLDRNENASVSAFYNQSNAVLNGESGSGGNGVTLVVDKAMQPSLKSVVDVLKEYLDFSEFVALLEGSDPVIAEYFSGKTDSLKLYQPLVVPKSGTSQTAPVVSRGPVIGFLGDTNYTLYAPTNAAMAQAYAQGLPRWSDLGPVSSTITRKRMAKEIMDFVRFHFQFIAVSTDGQSGYYKSVAFNSSENVFYELNVQHAGSASQIVSRNAPDSRATFVSPNNLMAGEYVFNGSLSNAAITGTATKITRSSSILIHGINAPLFFSAKGAKGKREQFK